MTKRLVIAAAGAFGREVYAYAIDACVSGAPCGFSSVAGFVDIAPGARDILQSFDIRCDIVDAPSSHISRPDYVYVIAAGEPRLRRKILNELPADAQFCNVIHPTAYVASSARLGVGVVIAPFGFVGINSIIDDHAVLNTYASCGHDALVGKFCVLCPYAVINGGVHLEDEVFMGTHAGVYPRRRIGRRTSVSAGTLVSSDVAPGSVVAGNPPRARVIRRVTDE